MDTTFRCQRPTALYAVPIPDGAEPVTAAVLAGIGSRVRLYVYTAGASWTERACVEALPSRSIHGFRSGSNQRLVAFGQKSLRVFNVDFTVISLQLVTPMYEYEDWVLDAKWLGAERLAVITSHNKVLIVETGAGGVLSCHTSELNCILYTATLTSVHCSGETNCVSDLLVFAGTVFNEVAIWRCDQAIGKARIDHRLRGHNGVIFGIHVDVARGRILSVSDDRTIRLWTWSPTSSYPVANESIQLTQAFHGHSARVWKAAVANDLVVSVGEDANIIVWSLDGKITNKISAHKGKNIWCMTMDRHFLYTGGGDSAIKSWDLKKLLNGSRRSETGESSNKSTTLTRSLQSDFPRSVCAGRQICVEITNDGQLNCQRLGDLHTTSSHTLLTDGRLRGYTVMCGLDCPSSRYLACLGTSQGWVCLVEVDCVSFHTAISWNKFSHGKVMSCHLMENKSCPLLLLCWESGHMDLCNVMCVGDAIKLESSLPHQLLLPKSKQRFITSAVIANEQHLICADKQGSVHIYCIARDPASSQVDVSTGAPSLPVSSYPGLHGKAGVTDVVSRDPYVYTAGRDGVYRQFTLDDGRLTFLLDHKVHKELEWISRVIFLENGHLLIAGFHTTDFVLFDPVLDQPLARVPCGGGHRSWDITVTDPNHFYFVYIKDKQSHIISQSAPELCKQIQPEMHSAKITACCCLSLDSRLHLVTCSDDSTVQCSALAGERDITCQPVSTMSKHISNVRCCCVGSSLLRRDSLILLTGGGRAQLICTLVSPGAEGGPGQLRYLCGIQLSDRYLMTRRQLKEADNLEPDTRIMDVVLVSASSVGGMASHVIAAACSDGKVRFLRLDEITLKFTVVPVTIVIDHCPLVLRLVTVRLGKFLLLGSTSGRVHIYDVTSLEPDSWVLQPLLSFRPHQSGVNSMLISQPNACQVTTVTVITGGDDNSLVISEANLETGLVTTIDKFPSCHSAQITGIAGLNEDQFVSVSVDQRIVLWKRAVDKRWRVQSVKLTTVADIAAVSYSENRKLVIAVGEGIEAITLR